MSSPVKLPGAGNQSTRPRSISSPVAGSHRRRTLAWREGGRAPRRRVDTTRPVWSPDKRITAMADCPRPLHGAYMVWVVISERSFYSAGADLANIGRHDFYMNKHIEVFPEIKNLRHSAPCPN